MKRLFDLVAAAAALIVLSPLLAAAVLAIKLTSRGPVIYRGPRVGRGGAPFDILKLRTMRLGEGPGITRDRKSTRLNSSHRCISYAVFCLKKKKKKSTITRASTPSTQIYKP